MILQYMDQLTWGPYERLRPAQIDRIRRQTPIAYVPWGALEWHSYHNPIGLDGMLAHGQCTALAQETGGVVLPPLYVGTDTIKPYKGFRHSLEHPPDTIRRLCTEILEQLADEGFKVIVVITGHCGGRHTEALREAASTFATQTPMPKVWVVPAFEPVQDIYPSNHAAQGETSLQLLFGPEMVDLAALPADRVATLDEDGVWGADPRLASTEEGEAILRLFVERTLPTVRALLEASSG